MAMFGPRGSTGAMFDPQGPPLYRQEAKRALTLTRSNQVAISVPRAWAYGKMQKRRPARWRASHAELSSGRLAADLAHSARRRRKPAAPYRGQITDAAAERTAMPTGA